MASGPAMAATPSMRTRSIQRRTETRVAPVSRAAALTDTPFAIARMALARTAARLSSLFAIRSSVAWSEGERVTASHLSNVVGQDASASVAV